MYKDTFDFYRLFKLKASLCTLQGAPNVKFMLCIDTCREIPTVNVFYDKLFKSLYNLDLRGLTLFHYATKLRKLV
jgi:hypothetical protein